MKRLLAPLALAVLLSGCAVYEPAGYVSYPPQATVYSYPEYAYRAPPVYAAPVYVEPPVTFNFGLLFGGYGHGGHHHGGWGYRH
jgi:hypothetical protein